MDAHAALQIFDHPPGWAFHEARVPLSFALETRGRDTIDGREVRGKAKLTKTMMLDRRSIVPIGEEMHAMISSLGIALATDSAAQ